MADTLYSRSTGEAQHQIIFIHGNSMSHECWDDILNSELSKNYRLTALDLPGHGNSIRSQQPQKEYSIKGMSSQVKQFLDLVKGPYILAGSSLGANIIGELIKDVSNCKGILLVGSTAMGMGITPETLLHPNPNLGLCFTAAYTNDQLDKLIEDVLVEPTTQMKEKVRRIFTDTDPLVREVLGQSLTNNEFDDELSYIHDTKLPLRFVYGADEKICITNALTKIPGNVWGNAIELIPGSGHFSQMDQPHLLTSIIKNFANQCFA
jgi:pimeloyl-ACP methyl ester carboxylesterase